MAVARTPVLRHLAGSQTRLIPPQRRWAQVHDVRFLATTQQRRSVLEKYRDKLDRKARDEGHADIDALRKAYADKIDSFRRQADAIAPPAPPSPSSPAASSPASSVSDAKPTPKPNPKSGDATNIGIKPLSHILNMSQVRDLPTTELTALWRLRHASDPSSLCAIIPSSTYSVMDSLARKYPQFILPVPHPDQGAEIHFLQWTWDPTTKSSTVLFTQLAEYKARGEFAAPHTTVTHYSDLMEEKGVVLMQGHVAEDRGVKVEDARWLVMCLQRFYGAWEAGSANRGGKGGEDNMGRERAEERRKLLEWFGRGDERFSVEKLMDEAERMG